MTTIYGPQAWPNAFSYPGAYQSSAHGGADTPNADHPELAAAENVEMVPGAGPNGENVVDAVNTADYSTSGIALTILGSLASLQYDARGLTVEWYHKLLSSGLNEAGFGQLLVLTHGGPAGSDPGLGAINQFFAVEAVRTAGDNFDWVLRRRRFTGSAAGSGTSMSPGLTVGAGVADDGWRRMKAVLVPSTVTGAFAGDGTLGSAVVASDGSVTLYVDGALVGTQTGLNFVINYRATTNPEVYYGRGAWHGFSDMLGPHTGTWLYNGANTAPQDYSTPDCCTSAPGSSAGAPESSDPTVPLPAATATCLGGGLVPAGTPPPAADDNWEAA